MNQNREPIFAALLALFQPLLVANGGPFVIVSRRLQMPDASGPEGKPALYLSEHGEAAKQQGESLPTATTLHVDLFIYTDSGDDPSVVPATELNTMLDMVDAILTAGGPFYKQTLGGKVSHCWIEGDTIKVPGDLDGKGLAIVPIRILTP